MRHDIEIDLPAALETVLEWAQQLAVAWIPGPDIAKVAPRLAQLRDGDALQIVMDVDGGPPPEDAYVTIAAGATGTRVRAQLHFHEYDDPQWEREQQADVADFMSGWPALHEQLRSDFQTWTATRVINPPPWFEPDDPADPPAEEYFWTDWTDATLATNRCGRVTDAQVARLREVMPPRKGWFRRTDPQASFAADLDAPGCRSVTGIPVAVPGSDSARVQDIELIAPAGSSVLTCSQPVEFFYWPHTHRLVNWFGDKTAYVPPPREHYLDTLVSVQLISAVGTVRDTVAFAVEDL